MPAETPGNATRSTRKVYTVSRLNQEVQQLLESGFGTLWLQGEVSNFSRPASGHFYFSLKDSRAQIRCAMFKGRNRYVDFKPQDGDSVIVRGKLGLYATRGDYQLIVEHMEPAGAGKLQAAFEATKRDLDALGWFAAEVKKPLPELPHSIGIITSPTGAALRDVLHVLARRYRQAQIIIYPTVTQGSSAAPNIVKALQSANRRNETDVLLLVRGGGSLEDLWGFNEITVAQAIRDSSIPVVAGIGHEVDVTISDLVSDLRAPTPSAAAELATPDGTGLLRRVMEFARALHREQLAHLRHEYTRLQQLTARLQLRHPESRLRERIQRVDELDQRFARAWRTYHQHKQSHVQGLVVRLQSISPDSRLASHHVNVVDLSRRLQIAVRICQERSTARFEMLARALHSVSPLAVLERGYAMVQKQDTVLVDVASVVPGEEITARLSTGEIDATVSAVRPKSK